MTIEELEAFHVVPPIPVKGVTRIDSSIYGTAAYELASSYDAEALNRGLCPDCQEFVTRNIELSCPEADFLDCMFNSRHKFIVVRRIV